MMFQPAASGNGAMTFLLHAKGHWRAVPEQRCWTTSEISCDRLAGIRRSAPAGTEAIFEVI